MTATGSSLVVSLTAPFFTLCSTLTLSLAGLLSSFLTGIITHSSFKMGAAIFVEFSVLTTLSRGFSLSASTGGASSFSLCFSFLSLFLSFLFSLVSSGGFSTTIFVLSVSHFFLFALESDFILLAGDNDRLEKGDDDRLDAGDVDRFDAGDSERFDAGDDDGFNDGEDTRLDISFSLCFLLSLSLSLSLLCLSCSLSLSLLRFSLWLFSFTFSRFSSFTSELLAGATFVTLEEDEEVFSLLCFSFGFFSLDLDMGVLSLYFSVTFSGTFSFSLGGFSLLGF